ncbi:copper homeostasis protein CutC [Fusibacter bizertensis]|uniref:PF03932 family protein CutC n=1 Tax=Fusibacter bizertensis TaxID=1488331 RepID=A0ABT6NGX0_9FIRM|nr:copper homeostasis protein CutC [Fusibacter bizertensis]MDH8679686.1 copper homeostasis protein CutC [Fusibacter bizertensis]
MNIREACVGSFKESKIAADKGADRFELCENLAEGGTTPSYGTISLVHHKIGIPTLVMIRPRGGDFVYSQEEIDIMKLDIEMCKQIGVSGVVFGVLTPENLLDIQTMKTLVEIAKPLQITCHMAFDDIENQAEALEYLIELGIDRVLTKGGKHSAMDNTDHLAKLVKQADDRIIIVAGGGVDASNYEVIMDKTGTTEVHGTKIVGLLK